MEIPNKESNHIEQSYIESIQNLDIFCRDLVSHEDEELAKFEVVSEITEQEDILGGNDSLYDLLLVDFEATPKFELLEDSIYKELNPCLEEANCAQILKATQVRMCECDQIFIFDFTCMQVMADTHSYCNR